MPARRPTANKRKRQPDRRPRELPRGVHRRSITVGIYLLLTGLSLAVFSQTIHYNFVNFDDDIYVYNAPAIRAGLTLKGIAAAFTQPARWQLASVNNPLTYVGLWAIRLKRWRPSCHERGAAYHRRATAVSCNCGR